MVIFTNVGLIDSILTGLSIMHSLILQIHQMFAYSGNICIFLIFLIGLILSEFAWRSFALLPLIWLIKCVYISSWQMTYQLSVQCEEMSSWDDEVEPRGAVVKNLRQTLPPHVLRWLELLSIRINQQTLL